MLNQESVIQVVVMTQLLKLMQVGLQVIGLKGNMFLDKLNKINITWKIKKCLIVQNELQVDHLILKNLTVLMILSLKTFMKRVPMKRFHPLEL